MELMGPPPEFEDSVRQSEGHDSSDSDSLGLPGGGASPDGLPSTDTTVPLSSLPAANPSDAPHPPLRTSSPPPTSFRLNVEPRSESRASTMTGTSFATAQEGDSDDEEFHLAQHIIEGTDTTIRPGLQT